MSESISIGVDHGYAAMKTAHCSFPTGLVGYDNEPYTQQNVLEYGGKFYVVGSGRQPLQKDKTLTEDYYLLTLAAIARELAYRGAGPTAAVHLAAGLPLTSSSQAPYPSPRRKRQGSLISLFLLPPCDPLRWARMGPHRNPAKRLRWGEEEQGSERSFRRKAETEWSGLCDDEMRLDNRIPNASTCRSLELGMIRCLDEIAEQVRRALGLSMTAAQIESCLRGEYGSAGEQAREIIHREAGAYVHRLLSAIAESGLDVRAMPAIFLGGGAALLKRHVSATDGLCRPVILDDVCLNAKGYERLVEQMSRSVGRE